MGNLPEKKVDLLKKNNRVYFEFEVDVDMIKSDKPCKWNVKYRSVIGFGNAEFIDDLQEKKRALSHILKQYSSYHFELPDNVVEKTTVIQVEIENATDKFSPDA